MRAASHKTGGAFLLSRIRRLYPMYWIFATLVLLTYAVNSDWRLNQFDPSPLSVLKSYLILPQWGFPILGVGWTLEHEMIFYVFVAIMMLFWSMGGPARNAVAWLLATMGFLGCLHGPEPQPSLWAFHILSPYMLAFGFGWLMRCVEEMSPAARLGNIALFLSIGAAGYLVGTGYGAWLLPRLAIAAAVFTLFIVCRRLFEADNMLNRVGWKFGDASYSIYLSHWFVLSALGKMLGALQPPEAAAGLMRVLGITLSIAVGFGVWAYLEKPLDRWLRGAGPLPATARTRWAFLRWPKVSRLFSG
jgi:peptidoglycan/LPS O-acetylase OafA/YrhL